MAEPSAGQEIHKGRSVLSVKDATFTVALKKYGQTKGYKQIVQGVSIDMRSGETLAIMGPSGAGKTTFMDLLTLEGAGGVRTGSVQLNCKPVTTAIFKRYCAYVPQFDAGWAYLTCRESLTYAAQFYTQGQDQKEKVEKMLEYMGLKVCENTIVGHEFLKGLSGGQRRRLSLGIALTKDPLVVFLDEVTTGLDAASAANIASFLQQIAADRDSIIACTIHQPSASVFKGFTRLLLLSRGRVAYAGRTDECVGYMASIGNAMPDQENPADFMLNSVNGDFVEEEKVAGVLDAWARRLHREVSTGDACPVFDDSNRAHSCIGQLGILAKRQFSVTIRDPLVYSARIVAFFGCCMFFAIVYIDTRKREQGEILSRLWLHCWHVGVPCQMSIVCTLYQNLEWKSVRKEVRQGMYSIVPWLVAQTLVQIPYMLLLSLATIGPSGYGVAAWRGGAFGKNLLVHFLMLFVFEGCAQLSAVQFPHPIVGMLQVVVYWFSCFLFGGFLVAEEDVPWPFRFLAIINPMKYCIRTMIYNELDDTVWDGAYLDDTSPVGFNCPTQFPAPCLGRTGEQVVRTMRVQSFRSLREENTMLQDSMIILGVALAFKVLYGIFCYVAAKGRPPVKPDGGQTYNAKEPLLAPDKAMDAPAGPGDGQVVDIPGVPAST